MSSSAAYGGTQNITAAAPTNTGAVYTYQCASDGNIKLGSRGSGGTGTNRYGVRLRNNTGNAVLSITVSYTGYQLSLAENYPAGGPAVTNKLTFSYQTAATVSSLSAGTWTSVGALDYTAPNDYNVFDGTANSQISGYPCTVSQQLSQCIPVSIPDGNEIMLRWEDLDNALNDPHMAIDNVQVLFHFDNACMVTLPVEIIDISARADGANDIVEWRTASERDNDMFRLHRSKDGKNWDVIAYVDGAGNSTWPQDYEVSTDGTEGTTYYKLDQTDYNGAVVVCGIVHVQRHTEGPVQYFDLTGRPCAGCDGIVIARYPDGTSKLIYR